MAEDVRRNSTVRDLEVHLRRRNGEVFWALISVSAIEIDGAACILSTIRDVTAARAAEQGLMASSRAIRLSEERYRTVFQNSVDSITISRLDNQQYVDVNQSFLDAMGFLRDEVIGRTSLDIDLWSDLRDLEELTEVLAGTS